MEYHPESIDVQVGSIIYTPKELRLIGYPLKVIGFYEEDNPLMIYSWDKGSCNAMMFRNGENDKDGIAQPLPRYSTSLEAFEEVVSWLRKQAGYLQFTLDFSINLQGVKATLVKSVLADWYEAEVAWPDVLLDNSPVALAGCLVFIKAFGEKK